MMESHRDNNTSLTNIASNSKIPGRKQYIDGSWHVVIGTEALAALTRRPATQSTLFAIDH
jgi:hypothetical protein